MLVEEWLEGTELSVFAFVDGEFVSQMAAACDYKRAFDGDRGPNTGGMGSYSPPSFWNEELEAVVRATIMEPLAAQMVKIGCPYKGALYAGLMLTADGPKVLEFNCRLGDPETQVVLPRLRTDLLEIAFGAVERVSQQTASSSGRLIPGSAWCWHRRATPEVMRSERRSLACPPNPKTQLCFTPVLGSTSRDGEEHGSRPPAVGC